MLLQALFLFLYAFLKKLLFLASIFLQKVAREAVSQSGQDFKCVTFLDALNNKDFSNTCRIFHELHSV